MSFSSIIDCQEQGWHNRLDLNVFVPVEMPSIQWMLIDAPDHSIDNKCLEKVLNNNDVIL